MKGSTFFFLSLSLSLLPEKRFKCNCSIFFTSAKPKVKKKGSDSLHLDARAAATTALIGGVVISTVLAVVRVIVGWRLALLALVVVLLLCLFLFLFLFLTAAADTNTP